MNIARHPYRPRAAADMRVLMPPDIAAPAMRDALMRAEATPPAPMQDYAAMPRFISLCLMPPPLDAVPRHATRSFAPSLRLYALPRSQHACCARGQAAVTPAKRQLLCRCLRSYAAAAAAHAAAVPPPPQRLYLLPREVAKYAAA